MLQANRHGNNNRGANMPSSHLSGNASGHNNVHGHGHPPYPQQQHSKSHYPPAAAQAVHNQPLYGNLLNNYGNNGKSNSVASYNSRQSGGQVSIGSQSSSTSSIPAANATELDSSYRNPLSLRRESTSSFSASGQSNRVSPSVRDLANGSAFFLSRLNELLFFAEFLC